MVKDKYKKFAKAFTLIEALIVMTILVIFIGSLFIVFKSGLDSWKKAEGRLDIYQNARAALEIMSREISGAIINPTAPTSPGPNSIYFLGGYDVNSGAVSGQAEVYFIAPLNPGGQATSDLCEIGYWLDTAAHKLKRFYVTDKRGTVVSPDFDYDAPPGAPATIFSTGGSDDFVLHIQNLTFKFFDGANWVDTWDSRNGTQQGKLPIAVKIVLKTAEDIPVDPQTKEFETIVYLKNSPNF